jgi:hypothetical protein
MLHQARKKITIKQVLLSNNNWWNFFNKHADKLRPAIVTCITKLLSCRDKIRGYLEYRCSNPNCPHVKYFPFTCKCKACSSCGKKITEQWIAQQNHILPNTSWQHITLTMPCELWAFFWHNRWLLNVVPSLAAKCLLNFAKKRGIILGIFTAIHTFGRKLNRNVHFHISTTAGGLSLDLTKWKSLSFHKITLMKMWRYQIIKLFRKAYKQNKLVIPTAIQKQLSPSFTFNHFLDSLYQKNWIVDCQKPTANFKQIVRYLGSYFKRPPIAESKLRHFDGNEVVFKYLDHVTNTYRNFKLSAEQFIACLVCHIPDANFRMLRYYGFLANRVRGKLLPVVYQLLQQENNAHFTTPSFAELIQKNFGFNPLTCILCGQPLILKTVRYGLNIQQLLSHHRELALLKKI